MSFLDKLTERADNMGSKQIVILFIALILILALLITGLYFITKKPPKSIASTDTEQNEIKKELKSPIKPLPEPVKENKEATSKEESKTISIEDAKKLNDEIMSDGTVSKPDGPLDAINKLIKEDEKRSSVSKEQKSNEDQKSTLNKSEIKKETNTPPLPIKNPYTIGKKEDLGVMIDSIQMWNEEQIKEYETEKKKATKSK